MRDPYQNISLTYPKLNGNGEEIGSSNLGNSIPASDTRKVDKAGLNDATLTLGSPDDLLGEASDG